MTFVDIYCVNRKNHWYSGQSGTTKEVALIRCPCVETRPTEVLTPSVRSHLNHNKILTIYFLPHSNTTPLHKKGKLIITLSYENQIETYILIHCGGKIETSAAL
jgi:hypothetical protein